jgi:hypothetical protein
MSKFWFFDRKGRPTTNEKRIGDKLNSFINEGKVSANEIEQYLEEYGKPMNETELNEMFGYLTGEYSDGSKYQYDDSDVDYDDSDDSDDSDVDYDDSNDYGSDEEEILNQDTGSQKNPVDFNPFEPPVIERSYTQGFQPKKDLDDDSDSEDYDDDSDSDDSEKIKFSDEDMKMPSDGEDIDEDIEQDIPEPEWANTGGVTSSLEDDEEDEEDYDDEEDEDGGKLGGDNLQDLSPAQKRKSAEKTAEALLNMYCQFVPLPFKKWSSISDGKVQKLVFENKIDLSMQLENNISVKDYIDGTNEQVEEIFKVSDETREEIKDPLIDVLLEQDLALTPTQRLMLAIGGHVVTMGFSAYQLAQNNKQALETFEKFHNQMNKQKAPVYQETERPKKTPRPRPTQDNLSKVERESVEELMRQMTQEEDDIDDDDVIDSEHDPNVEVTDDYGDDD